MASVVMSVLAVVSLYGGIYHVASVVMSVLAVVSLYGDS